MALIEEQQRELREWVRQHLVVDVELARNSGNSVLVGLRFADEDRPFQQQHIFIPDDGCA